MEKLDCSCEGCKLKQLFFAHVSPEKLSEICQMKTERSYSRGEEIIRQGDSIGEFSYMKEGLVKLSRKLPDGRDQIISFSGPMDFVGLLSIFSSEVYNYSVTAIDDSVVCILDLGMVRSYAQNNALFAFDLMTRFSEATDKIILENLEIKRKHLRGRVAHVLLYFADNVFGSEEFELSVSRREIAEYIGMTTENVIRTLSELRKHEIIRLYGRDIQIVDRKRLQSISDFG